MSCTCGRSPTGKCVGWHKLSEEDYQKKKITWDTHSAITCVLIVIAYKASVSILRNHIRRHHLY